MSSITAGRIGNSRRRADPFVGVDQTLRSVNRAAAGCDRTLGTGVTVSGELAAVWQEDRPAASAGRPHPARGASAVRPVSAGDLDPASDVLLLAAVSFRRPMCARYVRTRSTSVDDAASTTSGSAFGTLPRESHRSPLAPRPGLRRNAGFSNVSNSSMAILPTLSLTLRRPSRTQRVFLKPGPAESRHITLGHGSFTVVSIADLRRMAQRRLPPVVFGIDGGAGDEITLRANETRST